MYVGITRARRHLAITWPADARLGRSPFVDEIAGEAGVEPARPRSTAPARPAGGPLFEALKRWRKDRSARDGVPAYVVFHDATLAVIAERAPRSPDALLAVPGVGPAKLERYGEDVLRLIEDAAC